MPSRVGLLFITLVVSGCALDHTLDRGAADAGADARAGEPEPLSYDDAEQVCIAITTCRLNADLNAEVFAGACALAYEHADASAPSLFHCVLAAGADCDAVRLCGGVTHVPVASCDGAPPTHCEGDTIVSCESHGPFAPAYELRRRCGAASLPEGALSTNAFAGEEPRTICHESPSRGVECVVGTCDYEGTRCLSPTRFESCEEGVITERADCSSGFECHPPEGRALPCIVRDETCTEAICDAGRFRTCQLDSFGGTTGHLWPPEDAIDCVGLGLACDPHRGCIPAVPGCDPIDFGVDGLPRCDGSVLSYCGFAGDVHTYDCLAHGWGGCDATDSTCVPLGTEPP